MLLGSAVILALMARSVVSEVSSMPKSLLELQLLHDSRVEANAQTSTTAEREIKVLSFFNITFNWAIKSKVFVFSFLQQFILRLIFDLCSTLISNHWHPKANSSFLVSHGIPLRWCCKFLYSWAILPCLQGLLRLRISRLWALF